MGLGIANSLDRDRLVATSFRTAENLRFGLATFGPNRLILEHSCFRILGKT